MDLVLHQDVLTTRKVNLMKKFLLFILILTTPAYASLLDSGYVSPESYAVNEADLTDYRYIPPSPKLNLDNLENMRFTETNSINNENTVKTDSENQEKLTNNKTPKEKKHRKSRKEMTQEEYEKTLTYKVAKWWVDQRYKREEPHHGNIHEIKVKARENYEKQLEEQKKDSENNY